MSGNLKECCCGSAPTCSTNSATWGCSVSNINWTYSTQSSGSAEFDATSTIEIGPFNNRRTKEIYRRGEIVTAQMNSQARVRGQPFQNLSNFIGVRADLTNPIADDDDLVTESHNLALSGYWQYNTWEAYGSGISCGCSGLGHLCCDREIVTDKAFTISEVTDATLVAEDPFGADNQTGNIQFFKHNPVFDPYNFSFSPPLNPYGCYTFFHANNLGFYVDVEETERVRVYEEGALVSDTGVQVTKSTQHFVTIESRFNRIGNQEECSSFFPLVAQRNFCDTVGSGEPIALPSGSTGSLSQPASLLGYLFYYTDKIVGALTGFPTGLPVWSQILNEYGTGTEISTSSPLEPFVNTTPNTSEPPTYMPLLIGSQATDVTWGSDPNEWQINKLSFVFFFEANHSNPVGT